MSKKNNQFPHSCFPLPPWPDPITPEDHVKAFSRVLVKTSLASFYKEKDEKGIEANIFIPLDRLMNFLENINQEEWSSISNYTKQDVVHQIMMTVYFSYPRCEKEKENILLQRNRFEILKKKLQAMNEAIELTNKISQLKSQHGF